MCFTVYRIGKHLSFVIAIVQELFLCSNYWGNLNTSNYDNFIANKHTQLKTASSSLFSSTNNVLLRVYTESNSIGISKIINFNMQTLWLYIC